MLVTGETSEKVADQGNFQKSISTLEKTRSSRGQLPALNMFDSPEMRVLQEAVSLIGCIRP
jgi:hypothetical protein